ncbi:HEAT repeat domain-containing protein [Halalkaliarchaeum sp. AArc-GB]|uniref:HEAT repeat domain-containing protein n=1 Tax=Halalkaliarchaeum sp. AArc-GB TaxID=3074078 RepID=UPI0028660425|nr:HEAT repeat domain-containing protein [Halalkaliarchaeum sp. AArc-GB]MDR5674091.1 HEAT repeat domain-containing protein [Halalkaliarchaeum sp. AArc-GB]
MTDEPAENDRHDTDSNDRNGKATDERLNPARSPGVGDGPKELSEIEVSRDVTLGTADPEEFTATDTAPVADATVEELCTTLQDGDRVDRRRAAVALAQRPAVEAAVEPLRTAVLEDPDPDVRQFAVEALASQGDETVREAVEAAASDDNPWVRAEAVVTLDSLDREESLPVLEWLLEDDHPAVRRNAMISLYKARGEEAVETLVAGLSDPDERVREWAAELLGGTDDDRAREELTRTADDDESDFVRVTAKRALGESSPFDGGGSVRPGGSNLRSVPGKSSEGDGSRDLNDAPDL